MARTALKIVLGFLSTAVFFAAFALVGDVVLAALAAISVVVAQIVFGRTTSAKPSVAIWGSLAIVLTLTGVSLAGDDTTEPLVSQTDVTGTVTDCACKPAAKVRGLPVPFRHAPEAPKALAPAPGPV
ncbi:MULTISPECIES: hypothetical protein [unclassified Afipia]|uniref:hypothetical protein n=1 Tax=unclassified Afipia TaxID=2642050 RepID=UPI0004238FA2|nr:MULTISPECIES: hypothetical protein [unclassified Afipia]MBQ8103885.1 hypothetical protein [Afipia sp.]MBS4003054.1 hypothetical protein [Afipia sp.]WIG50091.1 MAG: hypothetical protein OJF48_001008 [Afipia sp.]